ncbi:MAG: type II toxin-antitoxin system VapC family toxin [Pyrinomonadaceae bacterium]
MKKIFVDTAFVLSVVNERDQLHEKANELVKKFGNIPWVTTDLILYEVGNALARNSKTQTQKIISDFIEADGVEIVYASPELFRRAFAYFCDYGDKSWGLLDCSTFIVMKDLDITDALTNDKHFEQAGLRRYFVVSNS